MRNEIATKTFNLNDHGEEYSRFNEEGLLELYREREKDFQGFGPLQFIFILYD